MNDIYCFSSPFRFVQQQHQQQQASVPQQIQQHQQNTNTLAGLQQKLALLTTSSTEMASAAVAQPTSATQPSFQPQQFAAVQKSSFDSPLTYVIS